MSAMAQLKEQDKSDKVVPYPYRLDAAIDAWLKRRLPLVHRFNQLAVDWLSRPHPNSSPRSVLLSAIAALLILIVVYLLGR